MNSTEVLLMFTADDKEAEKVTNKWSNTLKTAGAVGASAFAAIGAASIATTKALWDGVNATAQYGDEIDKNSQKVGMNTEAYQKWDYVMKISGSSMSDCTVGLKTLTNKLDDFKSGSSGATAIFERLGISLDDVAKQFPGYVITARPASKPKYAKNLYIASFTFPSFKSGAMKATNIGTEQNWNGNACH